MRICSKCGKEKDEGYFHKDISKPSGYRSHCKKCYKLYSNIYYKNNSNSINKKRAIKRRLHSNVVFLQAYKHECGCYHCGEDDIRCLQLHHKDPTKKIYAVNAGSVYHKSQKEMFDELNKCIILCSNCHDIVHYRIVMV